MYRLFPFRYTICQFQNEKRTDARADGEPIPRALFTHNNATADIQKGKENV